MQIYQASIPYSNRILLDNIDGGRVLDVGGAEYVGRANAIAEKALAVVLLDVKPPSAEVSDKVKVYLARIEQAPASLGRFRHIVLSNVLEHLDSPVLAINRCVQLLEPAGTIHVLTPNCESLNRRIGVLIDEMKSIREIPEKEKLIGHLHTFTVSDMRNLLQEAGLLIRECRGVFLKPLPTPEMIKWPKARLEAYFEIASQIPPDLCHEVYFRAENQGKILSHA